MTIVAYVLLSKTMGLGLPELSRAHPLFLSLQKMSFEVKAEQCITLNSNFTSPVGFFTYLLMLPLPESLAPFLEWNCLLCIPSLHFEIIQLLWFCKLMTRINIRMEFNFIKWFRKYIDDTLNFSQC